MLKVGLTGGIGSGKTTVAEIFKSLNVPVYCSDTRAKVIMVESSSLRKAIQQLLGQESYCENGELNRAYIASKVFNDAAQLERLNAIVHPALQKDFDSWVKDQNASYVIKEAAILFESKANKGLDRVILVTAPKSVRLSRVVVRDGALESEVLARMDKQWPDTQKAKGSDYIIDNDNNTAILKEVLDLHELLLQQEV